MLFFCKNIFEVVINTVFLPFYAWSEQSNIRIIKLSPQGSHHFQD